MPEMLAVLISGGLDSAILLGDALRRGAVAQPIFMRCGLSWEGVELEYLRRFLAALARPELRPLVILDQPVADVYGNHWSVTGRGVPGARDPDEAVFLPGRNVMLLAKSLLWCQLHGWPVLALGSLQTNPFPDATPEFFTGMAQIVNSAMRGHVSVSLPLGGMKKEAVMRRGEGLPLGHTFSCIQPQRGLHCGTCNKCGERQAAFASAEMIDPTIYAARGPS